MNDISIAGPGSPVSLRKLLATTKRKGPLTVLIDQGIGIVKDEKNTLYITPADCTHQAQHYAKSVFDGEHVPAYIFRYIQYMMFKGDMEKYPTNDDLLDAVRDGKLTKTSPEYQEIVNYIKFIDYNPEGMQLLGLIQLIAGSLTLIRRDESLLRLYIELPETSLHPLRSARLMSMFNRLFKEYGYIDIE